MKTNKTMLSINETAKKLGVCPQTLRNWEKRNDFPFNVHYTMGGHRRYSLMEVEYFLNEDEKHEGGRLNE